MAFGVDGVGRRVAPTLLISLLFAVVTVLGTSALAQVAPLQTPPQPLTRPTAPPVEPGVIPGPATPGSTAVPSGAERIPALTEEFETHGVEHWARRTMADRLGDRFPSEGVEWWIKFMGRTPVSTIVGFNAAINYSDIRDDLPKIACPTFVVTTDESGLASVDETRAWQRTIRNSELLVVPGNSFHVAASDPDRCARATLDFIDRHGGA